MVLKAEAVRICNAPGTTTVAVKMLKGTVSRLFFLGKNKAYPNRTTYFWSPTTEKRLKFNFILNAGVLINLH